MRTSSSHHKNRRPDKFAISFLKSVDAVLASAAPWGGSSRSREDFDSYQFDRTNGASSRAHWARRSRGGWRLSIYSPASVAFCDRIVTKAFIADLAVVRSSIVCGLSGSKLMFPDMRDKSKSGRGAVLNNGPGNIRKSTAATAAKISTTRARRYMKPPKASECNCVNYTTRFGALLWKINVHDNA